MQALAERVARNRIVPLLPTVDWSKSETPVRTSPLSRDRCGIQTKTLHESGRTHTLPPRVREECLAKA